MLVNDDVVDHEAIGRAIASSRLNGTLTVAHDGEEAFRILRGTESRPALPKPRVILLDLNMPKMSGLEFLDALREDPNLCASVVFVVTTSANQRDIADSYQRQVAGYICKSALPEDMSALADFLRSYSQLVALPA